MRRVALLISGLLCAVGTSHAIERVCVLSLNLEFDECVEADNPVSACRSRLEANPTNLAVRGSLCDAHLDQSNHDAALAVLESGFSVHAGDRFATDLLERMRSNVNESRTYVASQSATDNARIRYLVLRCLNVGDLSACDEASTLDPDNADAHAGKGSILLEQGDPVGAIVALRRSLELNENQPAIADQLAAAEAERSAQLTACLQGNSVPVCRALLIEDDPRNYDIYYHIGDILYAEGQYRDAAAAFRSAHAAREDDSSERMIRILDAAITCFSAASSSACDAAFDTIPGTEKFAPLRARASLLSCQALAQEGSADASAVQEACLVAQSLNRGDAEQRAISDIIEQSRRSGDDQLAAEAQREPRPVVTPPVPPRDLTRCLGARLDGETAEQFISTCENLLARIDDTGTRTSITEVLNELRGALRGVEQCEEAAANGDTSLVDRCRAAINSPVGEYFRDRLIAATNRLESDSLTEQCFELENVTAAKTVCSEALGLTVTSEQRRRIESRILEIDARIDRIAKMEEAKRQCVNFSPERLAAARDACETAVQLSPDDQEIAAVSGEVAALIAAHTNDPLVFAAQVEAITY